MTPPSGFPTTCWSQVARAGDPEAPEARAALAVLCGAYWYPIYAFIRRHGLDPDAALDATQDYFARLLESPVLAAADRTRGRFRAFLRADCAFFLSHRRERAVALKRGGGVAVLPIDAQDAEGRYLHEPSDDALTPDRLFDRAWALSLLDAVLARLAREQADAGHADRFAALQATLAGGRAVPHAEIARQLGTTEAAVQAAASRLRKRYRALLRDHIAATLDDPSAAAIDAEIHDLFAALGG
jgi:DNA-directed RNA polymerase specialized sigma24 family protein